MYKIMKHKAIKERESNIELLRIVLMLMIISHHLIVHGLGLKNIVNHNYSITKSTYAEIIFNSFFAIGVNTFVFISGYFSIKFNLKKIISISLQALTYSILFYVIWWVINPTNFTWISFIRAFFPISIHRWWFITTYIGLYLISPLINAGVEHISKNELKVILIGIFVLDCFSSFFLGGISAEGYHIFHFIFLYLLGRYSKEYKFNIKNPKKVVILCTLSTALIGMTLLLTHRSYFVWQLFYYNNPILVISAMALFFVFLELKVGYKKSINSIASLTLGIYMIHDYLANRVFISQLVERTKNNHNPLQLALFLVALVLTIFSLSAIIEYCRFKLFNKLTEYTNNITCFRKLKHKISTLNKT